MVKVGTYALMHKKWTFRLELTKKTSHSKNRDFLRKRRLKIILLAKHAARLELTRCENVTLCEIAFKVYNEQHEQNPHFVSINKL